MNDLTHRLHSAETKFLAALGDESQILASCNTWSTLLDDVSTGLLTGSIYGETLSLAYSVASRVSDIASCYLGVKLEMENISALLHEDYDSMLRQMNALNFDVNAEPTSLHRDGHSRKVHHSATSNTPNVERSSPAFVPPAYEWLLDNLHNPYPTAEVKAQLATASSCQVSSINSWFFNARRRIGWTTLCREHFSNSRKDMIDVAYRALVKEDPQRPLSHELRLSFVEMRVATESMYRSTFTSGVFSGSLDLMVKDTTGGSEESIETGPVEQANTGKVRGLNKRFQHRQRENLQTAEGSYPSPARSFAEPLVPGLDVSLADESEEEEDVAPPILAGSKRRRSYIEPQNQLSPAASRPIKRSRASTTSQTHLPSPQSSTDSIELPSDANSPSVSSEQLTQFETNKVLPPRKRHVSDVDDSAMQKDLDGLTAVPCLHAMPDPLPCPNVGNESFNDWFNPDFDALFSIPPPVDAAEPDLSTSWEVELFKDYCIPENSTCAPKWPPPITDTDVFPATHLSEFDGLLQSIASDTYIAPSDNVLSSNITVDPHTTFLDSSIPDISLIDWTSLLDGSDAYQSTIQSTVDSTFLQHPSVSQHLPDIDLSMLQFPPLAPTVQSRGELVSKRVKLDQLHAMQEAVRQMEHELQSEGVIL